MSNKSLKYNKYKKMKNKLNKINITTESNGNSIKNYSR